MYIYFSIMMGSGSGLHVGVVFLVNSSMFGYKLSHVLVMFWIVSLCTCSICNVQLHL